MEQNAELPPENDFSNMLSSQAVKLEESLRLVLFWSFLIRQYSGETLTINLKSCLSPTVNGRGIFQVYAVAWSLLQCYLEEYVRTFETGQNCSRKSFKKLNKQEKLNK